MDRESLARELNERIAAMAQRAFYGSVPKAERETYLRASSLWPGYVVETERLPGDCTCPKNAIIHRLDCPAWPVS